ncbi:ribonuclease H-like domain-containing protein [Tanacetum coccineum]|uniref:Ribonuclease H-like domain-containing protein n=1 Tax=Tanacetum coccineum TaxID=301880 RepID=A0ABQ5CJH0_9ASTR
MAFVSSPSSTNEVNTAYGVSTTNTQVSPASTHDSTASTQISTANLCDDTVYAFLVSQPNGSQLVHEDLEQIHEDDLEEMDLKWQLALLSMRTRRFFQKTGRKITINGSDTAGYDKSKVECFNCHKMRHFARECRGPRNQDSRNRNQDSFRRTVNVEETSSKSMLAIDGASFDWSYMADDEVPTNMALMAFSDSEIHNDKTCSKTCLKSFETLKTQLDDLRIEFNKSEFNLTNYKRGLASVEEQLVFYKKNEPEFEGYGPKTSKNVSEDTSNKVRESPDAPMVEKLVSDDKLEKKTIFTTVAKIEFVRPKQQENPVRKPVKYAEMYSFDHVQANCNYHQREMVVSRNNYTRVNYNYSTKKAHPSAHRNMAPRAVLMKTGLRPRNTARPVNTAHPKTTVYNARPMPNSAVVNAVRANQGHPQKEDQGYVDSGCSRHMTGNMSYLSDFKEFNGGYVTFGGGSKRGKITVVAGSSHDYIVTPLWKDDSLFDSFSKNASDAEPQPSSDIETKDDEGVNKDSGLDDQERPCKQHSVDEFYSLKAQSWMPKMCFLYGKIEEEVYVCQPPGFKDPNNPDKVYKVVKTLYGLHQALRAWLNNWIIDVSIHHPDRIIIIHILPLDLVAYSDSDYARASLDRKSTTGGYQFLGCRLISWQCKKKTMVSTSSTESEYVAAASCYGQKSEGSEGFHQIVDFLTISHIRYALTESPNVLCFSTNKQFWQTATASTLENGDMEITTTIDGKVKVVYEASI